MESLAGGQHWKTNAATGMIPVCTVLVEFQHQHSWDLVVPHCMCHQVAD